MPAVMSWGAELEVDLGLGHQAGAAVWESARWDVEAWSQTDTTMGDWVDVTCSVLDDPGVELGAGSSDADGVVTRWEAATCGFTLFGAQWDPWGGPWAGVIGPGLPVRVRWRPTPAARAPAAATGLATGDWQDAFVGSVADGGYGYTPSRDPRLSTATVQAVDATQLLVEADGLEQDPLGAGEPASARVTRVLDNAAWPPGARDITPGGTALRATTLADVAWTELLAVADTDLALLWLRHDGRLAYRPRARTGQGAPLPGLTVTVCPDDDPAAVHALTVQRGYGTIRNIASISRQKRDNDDEPYTKTVIDDASRARYGPRRYTRTDLLHVDDEWSDTVAATVVVSGAWPGASPRLVELDSQLHDDPRIAAVLLALEPEHAFRLVDPGGQWTVGVAGWAVTATRAGIRGTLAVDDWTRWAGSAWDLALFDRDPWGI